MWLCLCRSACVWSPLWTTFQLFNSNEKKWILSRLHLDSSTQRKLNCLQSNVTFFFLCFFARLFWLWFFLIPRPGLFKLLLLSFDSCQYGLIAHGPCFSPELYPFVCVCKYAKIFPNVEIPASNLDVQIQTMAASFTNTSKGLASQCFALCKVLHIKTRVYWDNVCQ